MSLESYGFVNRLPEISWFIMSLVNHKLRYNILLQMKCKSMQIYANHRILNFGVPFLPLTHPLSPGEHSSGLRWVCRDTHQKKSHGIWKIGSKCLVPKLSIVGFPVLKFQLQTSQAFSMWICLKFGYAQFLPLQQEKS